MVRRFFRLSTTPLKIRQLPFGLNNLSKTGVSLLYQKSTKYVFYIFLNLRLGVFPIFVIFGEFCPGFLCCMTQYECESMCSIHVSFV